MTNTLLRAPAVPAAREARTPPPRAPHALDTPPRVPLALLLSCYSPSAPAACAAKPPLPTFRNRTDAALLVGYDVACPVNGRHKRYVRVGPGAEVLLPRGASRTWCVCTAHGQAMYDLVGGGDGAYYVRAAGSPLLTAENRGPPEFVVRYTPREEFGATPGGTPGLTE